MRIEIHLYVERWQHIFCSRHLQHRTDDVKGLVPAKIRLTDKKLISIIPLINHVFRYLEMWFLNVFKLQYRHEILYTAEQESDFLKLKSFRISRVPS